MKILYTLLPFAVMGLVIPVYAQNVSHDEVDIKVREEIKVCKVAVDEDDSLTNAEKTVAKRNCETQITNRYKNVDNDYQNLAEKKAKLNNMQKCTDWYPQYRFLTEEQFRVQRDVNVVSDCILLYNDSIWKYDGEDRLDKLAERLDEIKAEFPTKSEPEPGAYQLLIPQLESNIVRDQQKPDQNSDLEEKIRLLEEEIAKKDAIIIEQLKVIMDLANRIKNVIFEQLGFLWPQA